MHIPKLTRNQKLVLSTLAEHADSGGEAIATRQIDTELDRRHNRHMDYDQLHGVLKRMETHGWVKRDKHKPMRWKVMASGRKMLSV